MLSITILMVLLICSTYGENSTYLVNTPFGGKYDLNPILPYNTWGTLRSGHYFGLKSSSPDSIVTGMMWFSNKLNSSSLRHFCDSNDNLERFGWLSHDFRSFGIQEIIDGNLTLQTSFIKFSEKTWTAKISAKSKCARGDTPISLILYVAKESENDSISMMPFKENTTFEVHANSHYFGKFNISVSVEKGQENVLYRSYLNSRSDPPLVSLSETLLNNSHTKNLDSFKLLVIGGEENSNPKTNFIAYQIIVNCSIEIQMHFESENQMSSNNSNVNESYNLELKKRSENYDKEFDLKFNLSKKGFNASEINFGKAALSNMIGSIGYFNGYAQVLSNYTPEPVPYGPLQLLTAVPARSVFPRGFLWDEGFHQLIINNWDMELSLTIIKSWLNLMNAEGWIPREVTLGYDAIARIPAWAIVQRNTHANPPALLITLDYIIDSGKVEPQYFKEIFPRLQIWYDWYNTSQVGKFPSTYRWRGRNNGSEEINPGTLTSGLDDYPRASEPTEDEIHVDLRCWIAFASKLMSKIASLIKDPFAKKYSETAEYLSDNALLEKWHWSEKYQMFLDKGLHSTNVTQIKVKDKDGNMVLQRKVLSLPEYDFVPDIGYVSLFPLMFNIINPNNTKLGKVLDHLENSTFLWSEYGIRSLSTNSVYYQRYNGESRPYWRGAIWINLNYLILKSLHNYSQVSGPYQKRASEIYQRLRHNLISTMYREYVETGYIWEQYNDMTGKGDFSHPFTGWSSLILLIMSEKY